MGERGNMDTVFKIVLWRMFQGELDEREFLVVGPSPEPGRSRYSVLLHYVNRSLGDSNGTTTIARCSTIDDAFNVANMAAETLEQYQWTIMHRVVNRIEKA